jgi:alpha-N-arabinofuranosidase
MANIAPIINTRGPLYVHSQGIVKRTTFHALAMYANLLEARVGKVKVECADLRHGGQHIPMIDAVATVDESGKNWSLALVNRCPDQEVDCTIKLGDTVAEGALTGTILAGHSPDTFNDEEHADRVVPENVRLAIHQGAIKLQPHSLTIVKAALTPR